ncbi:MAG TPA: ABC transporter ATP-binding protein [Trebonia sp.]|nr:ABC transporter ATP-binding protein [Trebonia sp.]
MIEAHGITRTFAARRGMLGRGGVRALRGVDVTIPDRGAASFIGESGCGKTTLGRILCGLEDFDEGDLVIDGQSMTALKPKERAPHYRRIQLIHQDPYTALNPTRTISQILTDPLRLRAGQTGAGGTWVTERRAQLLELVGLDPDYVLPRYPHMLSGGMRQRVVIARALTVDPVALVADEAVSMIDVSLRLGILQLLRDLRTQLGVSVLFITHDVATARYVGHGGELYVLYRGTVVERGPTDALIASPVHPYTQSLLSAVPVLRGIESPARDRVVPKGPLDERAEVPGCLFEPRCPFAEPDCRNQPPPLVTLDSLGDAPGEAQAHACLHPARRSVVPVPAVRGTAPEDPERSVLPTQRPTEPGPSPT